MSTNPQTDKAEALLLHFAAEAHRRKWAYDRGVDDDGVPIKSEAFDALHRLGDEMSAELHKLRAVPAAGCVVSAAPTQADVKRVAAALREHYLCTNRDEADADGKLPCRCGDWREPGPMGSDEDDWDTHLAEVALAVLPSGADRGAGLTSVRPQTLTAIASHIDARSVAILRPESETYAEWQAVAAELRRVADEARQQEGAALVALNLADGPVRCPLCPTTVTLHTPNGARAHFTTVHPEQRVTGRGSGPWPLLVTNEDEARQQPEEADGELAKQIGLRDYWHQEAMIELEAQLEEMRRLTHLLAVDLLPDTEAQQQKPTTADKAAALGMTDTEYRAHSHRAAVDAIRGAMPGLYASVALRVEDALAEAQQQPDTETDCCGAEPPTRADDPSSQWGDCWCTLPPGHDGEHRCEPCTDRHGAPGWSDAPAVLGPRAADNKHNEAQS